MRETFDIFLIVMAVIALAVFIALHFLEAGYGMRRALLNLLPLPESRLRAVGLAALALGLLVVWLASR